MPFDIIKKLRLATPEERGTVLQTIYDKNMEYFSLHYPTIIQFLKNNVSPYRIDMTTDFLNIVHDETNILAHPDRLDTFAELLSEWVHEGWQEFFNLRVIYPENRGDVHNQCVTKFISTMDKRFPAHQVLWDNAKLNLKVLPDGRRFSPPIVFFGIFHGLHIAEIFRKTVFTNGLFLEPEPERFEVSCYFLDYKEVADRLGSLHIYVGEEAVGRYFARFFDDYLITPHMWTRGLPAYPSEKIPMFVETVKSLQSTRTDTVFSFDLHVQGLQNACKNFNANLPLLAKRPKVSNKCKIAIVAPGPSLANDIKWLQSNKERLLIFAVHSAVSTLRRHGITPDFQFNLDTQLTQETLDKLELHEDIPIICLTKVGGPIVEYANKLYLVGETHASNSVNILQTLAFTTPSSTNLAFTFACFCRPQVIYLLGCDMGFESLSRSHVTGHHISESNDKDNLYKRARQMMVEASYNDKKFVQTTSFLNNTRMAIEAKLAEVKSATQFVNFSKGAKIGGTVYRKSENTKLPQYKKKEKDIQLICGSFAAAKEGISWRRYPDSGRDIFQRLREEFLQNLTINDFQWKEFSQSFNGALFDAMEKCGQKIGKDYRMAIYNKMFLDLLSSWYIYVIFRDDIDEARTIYEEGYKTLEGILATLEWPSDIDPV